ncbi:MAG: hypothetical protein JNM27_23255 [Leptospirales bacterium]|nr:hypothetical protein [Leptospirales bacterium]
MILLAVASTITTIAVLYRTAYRETIREMEQSASMLAGLMEVVGEFDAQHGAHTKADGSRSATLIQISQGLLRAESAHRGEELVLGELDENANMRIIRRTPSGELGETIVSAQDIRPSEPMRLALGGTRGGGEFTDYKGTIVRNL